jgi:hypothetical protein
LINLPQKQKKTTIQDRQEKRTNLEVIIRKTNGRKQKKNVIPKAEIKYTQKKGRNGRYMLTTRLFLLLLLLFDIHNLNEINNNKKKEYLSITDMQ